MGNNPSLPNVQVGNLCNLPELKQPNEDLLKFLSQVKLFKQLPKELFPVLAAISKQVNFAAGQDIIRQGEPGNDFYVLMQGEAKVTIDGNQVAAFRPYDYFGERALLHDEPRNATITADSKVLALTISREMFQQLGLHQKLQFERRKAVGGGVEQPVVAKPATPKNAEERAFMKQAIMDNANLSAITSTLDEAAVDAIVDVAWKEIVPAGKQLITEGDIRAEYFYIVWEGKFEYTVTEKSQPSDVTSIVARAQSVGSANKGDSFGELALLYMAPRAASVVASSESIVWVIDRSNFKSILAKHTDGIALDYVKYLDKVEVLEPLQLQEKQALAKALSEMFFSKGEDILVEGQEGDTMYIMIDGVVDVYREDKKVNTLTATLEKACFFGERALLHKEPRNATIKVESESAQCLKVDKLSLDLILGPLKELTSRGKGGKSIVQSSGKTTDLHKRFTIDASSQTLTAVTANARKFGLIKMKELSTLGLLGNGGFGSVSLVEHATTKNTYALKMLSKGYVVQAGMQKSVIMEKDIQLMCDSHFIVKLHETFTDDQSLWFLLDAALGGELYATYSKRGFHGRVKHAQFYVVGVVLAFEYLHSLKVVYRDLKPENLLLTEKGRIKLTDMGLAKVIVGKTYTTCGTPDYFAPEMVSSTGHTHAVDWWTLGILCYELMCGHPPFEAATPMQIYRKVAQGINSVRFPRATKGPLEELIKSLCNKSPSKRLPMKAGGVQNIKTHPWLEAFDWVGFENSSLQPPYVPDVRSKRDLGNFDARAGDAPPMIKYRDDKTGWDKEFATST